LYVVLLQTVLPAAATDAYYRDEIGNISTSHMKVLSDSVELDLRPRFPLFGGWKTHYVIGYNVPSYEYLFNAGNCLCLDDDWCLQQVAFALETLLHVLMTCDILTLHLSFNKISLVQEMITC
jgi:hypothetical protein